MNFCWCSFYMSRTEGPQKPQQLFIYDLMPFFSTTETQGNHCGNKIHTHHFTFMKSRIWGMILIWNFAFFTGMKWKINPGVFKTKASYLSQNYLCTEKNPENQCHTQRMTHGHVHLLWLLGSGKGGGNASTRSGCQHSGSSAKCFHKYDNISDYSLLLAAVTHRHFGGVGGSKRAYF